MQFYLNLFDLNKFWVHLHQVLLILIILGNVYFLKIFFPNLDLFYHQIQYLLLIHICLALMNFLIFN